ncbi:MAG: tRNA pseudouridine(55) synthase TruB [Nocardioidaceae bacterium]|nr:tRNA pseudouridine(55) synthase TruB [Nocardioidaceae bacterium]
MPAPDGLLVVDKPPDWTSHDVVGRCRRLAGTRKVGHAGTLDPMATGVLVVGVGRATRLLGHLALSTKGYDATLRLGQTTVSDDAQGEVTATADIREVTSDAIESVVARFVGDIEQIPSAVSAIKVNGERAYKRVRSGEQVVLAARPVTVSQLDIVGVRRSEAFLDVDVTVECSTGTYVRALARDIGASLGVGGHLTALRRTRVGPYDLGQAHTLDELANDLTLVTLDDAATANFTTYPVDDELVTLVRNGRAIPVDMGAADNVAVMSPTGEFLALYEQRGPTAHAVAIFAPA